MLKKPGEGHSIRKGKGQLKKKNQTGGRGGETAFFLFWVLLVEVKAPAQPHGPGGAELRRGRSGAARRSVLPFSHSKQGRAAGLLFPLHLRAPFPSPATLIRRMPPASAGGSLHCPLGRSRILHDTQTLCRNRQYHPRCLLNKFQVFF